MEVQPVGKRRRVNTDGNLKHDGRNSRIRIPATCAPGLSHLTQELGLRSNGEAIQWLLEQIRPELVIPQTVFSKIVPRVNSANDSVPIPIAFAYPKDSVNGKITALVPIANGGVLETKAGEDDSGSEPGPRPTVRATVVQASTVFYDTQATLDKAERLIAGAAAYGSQLVVFPEAFVGGYPRIVNFGVTEGSHSIEGNEEFQKYRAAAIDVPGPEVDRLAAIAGKYEVHLIMGVVEREGSILYCTILFFDSQGQFLGKHRKLMPMASEHTIWVSGDEPTPHVYKTQIGRIGGLICWDNRMPILRTELYSKDFNHQSHKVHRFDIDDIHQHGSETMDCGIQVNQQRFFNIGRVEIYCAPTADARDVWRASMTHIAIEGGCFVLSANQFCQRKDYPLPPECVAVDADRDLSPDSIVCSGGSVIISPSGVILAGPNFQGESLISADLDLGEISRAKLDFNVVGCTTSVGSITKDQVR